MKMVKKIIFLLTLLMIFTNMISVLEYTVSAKEYSEMLDEAKSFISMGESKAGSVNISGITSEFKPIGQLLTMVGAGVMVAVTTYMGIKYVTAAPDAQAKLKEQLIGVIVSGIVIFGAYGIWSIVGQIAMTFEK